MQAAQQALVNGQMSGDMPGLRAELADTEKDDSSTISTVIAVAMAGRAIKPSLDTLQQLVNLKPKTLEELSTVAGISANQQRMFGSRLLDKIREVIEEQYTDDGDAATDLLSYSTAIRYD